MEVKKKVKIGLVKKKLGMNKAIYKFQEEDSMIKKEAPYG